MARWRTLNKRAKRRREKDAEIIRDVERLIAEALAAMAGDVFKRACDDFAKALNQSALAMRDVILETNREIRTAWGPLDPKYAVLRRRAHNLWPDVVLEDILDAEYIGED